MAIFNSYVSHYQRVPLIHISNIPIPNIPKISSSTINIQQNARFFLIQLRGIEVLKSTSNLPNIVPPNIFPTFPQLSHRMVPPSYKLVYKPH